MKCFRYLASHAFETLNECRFKLAKPCDFNDPFDCVGATRGKISEEVIEKHFNDTDWERRGIESGMDLETVRKRISSPEFTARNFNYSERFTHNIGTRKTVNENTLILCFSNAIADEKSQMLMWSHYAKGLKGVRIGLETEKINILHRGFVKEVQYSSERPTLDLTKVKTIPVNLAGFLPNMVMTKDTCWDYEHEIRFITMPKYAQKEGDFYYWKFQPDAIWRVDLGIIDDANQKAKDDRDKVINLVRAKYPHVELYQAVLDHAQYKIKYEHIQ